MDKNVTTIEYKNKFKNMSIICLNRFHCSERVESDWILEGEGDFLFADTLRRVRNIVDVFMAPILCLVNDRGAVVSSACQQQATTQIKP